MPPHYAISELAIIAAALWFGVKCWKAGYVYAAVGIFLLGLAATIGTLRILSTPSEALTVAHKTVSGFGGLTGMALIALEFIKRTWPENQQIRRSRYALCGVFCSLLAAIIMPTLTAPILMIWAGILVIAAFSMPAPNSKVRAARAGGLALIIFNFVVIRQNPMLGPSLSWHLYHIVVAIWIWFVYRVLSRVQ